MSVQSLADALLAATQARGETTPTVRGADWQMATVTAINPDGTIDCGQIRARRLDSYLNPAVGDLVALLRSGAGNWIALDRLATSAGTAWTAYTPAWTASTNPSLGNGSLVGRYHRIGRTIIGGINMVFGSTTTGGSGVWSWSLPAPAAADSIQQLGVCEFIRTGADRYDGHGVISPGNATFGIYLPQKNAAPPQVVRMSSTASPMSPATSPTYANSWQSGDQLRIQFQYEAAA